MKRHLSLVSLSREHHSGLVMAQGLILGQSKAPRSDWPTDRRQQVVRVLTFFEANLQKHFEAEEEHLFPRVIEHLSGEGVLICQLRAEHDDMRGRIRAFERDPTTNLGERLSAFGERLKAHIRKEEHLLFERIQRLMEPAVLEAIGVGLRQFSARETNGPSCRILSHP